MERNHAINVHYETEITHIVDLAGVVAWCEKHFAHGWNIVADSGPAACRFNGRHYVMLLCDNRGDLAAFKLEYGEWL